MSGVKSAGSRLTGSAPVGSVESSAEVVAAGLDSSAGVPGGAGAEGVVALLVQPAQKIVAARISGSSNVVSYQSPSPELSLAPEHRSEAMRNP